MDADKKRLILLSVCGVKTYKFIRNWATLRKPGDVAYDDIVQLVANHHNPKPSVIVQRFKFHSHFSSFRNIVILGAALDDMLRDRGGINANAIQCCLLGETPPLTFQKALDIPQGTEMAANDATDIQIGNVSRSWVVHQVKGDC